MLHAEVIHDERGPVKGKSFLQRLNVAEPSEERNPSFAQNALGERHVGFCFLEGKAVAEERDEALHTRPLLDGLVENDFIPKYDDLRGTHGRLRR